MAKTDRTELKRLILQIERALVARTHLRTLLESAGKTVARHRRALRDVTTRIKRSRRVNRGARHTKLDRAFRSCDGPP